MKKLLIFLLSLALAGIFVSCNDGIDSDSEALRASADGKTYLVIGGASLGRNVVTPKTASKEDLVNFSLTGTFEDETEAVTFIKAEEALTFEELGNKQIEIEAGNWTFTLSAELNSIPFSDTKSIEIKAGVVNTLSFDLKADSSYGGGISVTLNFPLDKSINSVVAKLSDPSGTNEIETKTFELADFAEVKDTDGEVKEYSVTYSRNLSEEASRIPAGSYYLVFDFMAEGTSVPINSFPYYVRVVNGFTSSAVDSVKLNETYSITYSYFANGEALEATDSSIGIADSPEGFVFPAKYSRKSETISLPAMAKTVTEGEAGYAFAGWFEDADFTKPITEIASGSTGNKTLYAAFINRITVSANGKADASVVSGAVDSIGTAITKIVNYEATDVDWTILIDGKVVLEGLQLTVSSSQAKSLTFAGLHENSGNEYIDSIDGGVVGATNADAIDGTILVIVEYCVPVTVKNLKVTHGGRAFENSGKLTLDDGAWITDNHSWMAGGINNCGSAILTMKEGSRITNNSASNWGGGICNTATVIMEGGEISGNVSPAGAGVCHYGTDFIISGNASIPVGDDPENPQDFYFMADSNNGAYPITVAGELTDNNSIYLTFGGAYNRYTGNVLLRTSGGLELTSDIISKFQIEQPESVDYEWSIGLDGKLAYKSATSSGTASVDNRALTIVLDKADVCLNDTITFSATASDGTTVTKDVTYTAELLWKGKEINAYGEDTYYVVTGNKLSFSKALPKTGTYQLYVTATQSINDTTASKISSSQTFEISVTNEYTTPDTQVALYNTSSDSISYYLKDFDSVDSDLPTSPDMAGNSDAMTAFDAFGNFYIFSSSKLNSNNPVIASAEIDLSELVGSGYGTKGFVIDVKKNEAYAYCSNYNSETGGYTVKLFKLLNLLSSGYLENYEPYTFEFNKSPNKIAIENEILYTYGSDDYDVVSVYSLSEGTISGPKASVNVSDNVDLDDFSVSDMIVQDGKLYLTLKSSDTSGDAGVWELYSRGAVAKIDFDKTPPEVSTCGWISDNDVLDTSSFSDHYVYTYYVEKKGTYEYELTSNQFYCDSGCSNPALISCSDLQIPADDEDPDSSPKTLKIYAPTDSESLNSSLYLSGPQKFVAIKPKKLVIADDGVMFYTDDLGAYKYKNVNRIVTIDLENFAGGIDSEIDVKAEFDEKKEGNFVEAVCGFTPIASASLYKCTGEFKYEPLDSASASLFYNGSSGLSAVNVASAFDSQIFFNIPCGDN
ncbi:InlB B-repeat-containing protein [Treponema sp.]|uniref:InlB B-repeat-containing protein n=1 Tax=Treponema sp. TaxID=166 RepID=UPI0025EF83DC|nr:InlB B-repeat-containing protein [Treponema sp.]MBR4321245.1 InlB B-repeat-containing protein [Treponema sp.]